MISNKIEFKSWLEKIIFSHDYSDKIFHEFFKEKFFNVIIWDDLTELINQVQLQDIKVLEQAPEFLGEYYCVNRAIEDSLDDKQYLDLRYKVSQVIYKNKEFNKLYNKYSDFKIKIENVV